ncbi:MAG: cytochrome P450 [Actinobacteria bacterium]|nr:cytochrome P450 [Actinomycetota bacterium]
MPNRDPSAGLCPALHDYDPFAPDHLADPYPLWRLSQREAPVFYVSKAGFWAVTGQAEILEAARNNEVFSSRDSLNFRPVPEHLSDRLPNGFPQAYPSLINSDPPEHSRIRKIANRSLTPRHVTVMEPAIREIATSLLESFVDDGAVDIVGRFAVPLPVTVIARFLGVDENDLPDFQRWSHAAFLMSNPNLDEDEFIRCATCHAELNEYLQERIAERRQDPRDDLLSRLVDGGEETTQLSNEQIISLTAQLLIGGNVTTTDLLGNLLLILLSEPERLQAVRSNPALIGPAIEEVLRIKSSIRGLFRTTTREVELGGVTLPEGATVWLLWGAANHDERIFPRPDEFELSRPNNKDHLAFGKGTHFCIGAPLARAELRIALELLLERLPDLRLADEQELVYPASPVSQGVERLQLEWTPGQPAPSGHLGRVGR